MGRLRSVVCRLSAGAGPPLRFHGPCIGVADTAIANFALPAIAADLHADPADVIRVVNVYRVAMVGTPLPLAVPGEVVGRHRRSASSALFRRRIDQRLIFDILYREFMHAGGGVKFQQ
jgi:hypothetical protein